MTNTAASATITQIRFTGKETKGITFTDEAHEKFYYLYLPKCRTQDVYHKALIYCLGISEDTRNNIGQIYNFKTDCIIPDCLHEGWITSGSARIVRMAFNLYCNSAVSVFGYDDAESQLDEYGRYTVEDLFCCGYAPYFWEAVRLRYPEYCN
ncbi:MAG: DUF6075 family protein [Bacteroides fragilis]|nr:DUF6075 family protein [Bacteroides fragilis]